MSISKADVAATAAIFTPSLIKRAATLRAIVATSVAMTSEGDSPIQRWSSFIGIVTAIVGNILISFALNIQRYAHIRIHRELEQKKLLLKSRLRKANRGYGTTNGSGIEQDGAAETDPLAQSFESSDLQEGFGDAEFIEQTTYLKSPYWWAGIVLMTIGETGNFLAYGFAPASIVSPLGVVALVSNCVIAPIMLKERFRLRDFWGVVVAVGGAVTVVLSAKHEEKRLGPHEVIGAITTMEFEIYMAVTVVLISILVWASPKYGKKTILIDLGLVGLFGGYTALSTKGVASMLSTSLLQAFANPITYALIAVLIGTAVMQVKYVNRALQRFDSTQVIPVQFVMFTISVIIGSAILYRDFESTTPERVTKFVGGCLLTFFGVFLITSGRPVLPDVDFDVDSEDEERIALAQHEGPGEYYQDSGDKYATLAHPPLHHEILHTGETTDDDDFPSYSPSRRSSHVSWSRRSRAESPRGHPALQPPSLRLHPSTIASGSVATELPTLAANAVDSTAALHSSCRTSLHDAPRPPLSRLASHTGATHAHHHADAATLRPVTPARHSISQSIIPGPFISPLSSSLSAVVADTLRRGTDIYGSTSRRRPRLNLQRTRSGNQQLEDSEDEDAVGSQPGTRIGSPRKSARRREDVEAMGRSLENETWVGGRRRARSLGHKLSEFFSGMRGVKMQGEEDEQVRGQEGV